MHRVLLLLLMVLSLLPLTLAAQELAPVGSDEANAKIAPAVKDKVKNKGKSGFWLVFGQDTDLQAAATITDWNARGQYVVDQLQKAADTSQADIRRVLNERKTPFQSFWVTNAIHVERGDQALLDLLAARREVVRVEDEKVIPLPPVTPSARLEADPLDPQWGITEIKAREVWNTYNVRGQGIVVASIDTGVDYAHPAITRQYRGRLANGTFDHNYNWFDPSKICSPGVPCDNHGHGTHVTGTMVGDDGGTNKIGVAPAARWIAAKGCEAVNDSGCSDTALLAAGQWMLAPTDLAGNNPRADLRPHIVNNSWGGDPMETFYKDVVRAWTASGIFPVFSNGNNGPGCETATAPGNYTETYAVGAYNDYGMIADFSSRGVSALDNVIKPNIAAPGQRIRSSLPNNGYDSWDGTSMAAPHVAGVIALMWSASSPLLGDITTTRTLLDQTAIDTNDTFCGGTAAKNNVWGEGKLNALAAVQRTTRDTNRGTLAGTITNGANGQAILGATVAATGPLPQQDNRMTTTVANGSYSLQLPAGTYNVTVSAWGYASQTITNVAITAGGTATRNVQLVALPRYTVSGTVRDVLGTPVAGITMRAGHPSIPPATTNASGGYTIAGVPQGSYLIQAEAGRCHQSSGQNAAVNGNTTVNFALAQQMDAFGYTCQNRPTSWVPGATKLPISGYEAKQQVTLPFPFRFYGQTYTTAFITTDGYLSFQDHGVEEWNSWVPDSWAPNAAIFAMWDEFDVDASAGVYTAVTGTAPNRQFVIEWRNARFRLDGGNNRVRAEAILHENGQITLQYADIGTSSRDRGDQATVGIENADGTMGFEYSYNQPVLNNTTAIRFVPPVTNMLKNSSFEEYVWDANYDPRPTNWTQNANFQYDYYDEEGRFRTHSGIHTSTANANYTVGQQVGGIVAGQRYRFNGWVNIPHTTDTFSFKLEIQWRNSSNAVVGTTPIKTYTSRTFDWDQAVSSAVAPAGAVKADVRMVVGSLNALVRVDDFTFGK